jgi:hypothetical protein
LTEEGIRIEGYNVTLQALTGGKSIERVKENQLITLRIKNHGPRLRKSSFWIGRACVWTLNSLDTNAQRDITINVGDYVGDTVLYFRDSNGTDITKPLEFFIEPRGLTSEEFNQIRHKRIPYLLKRFGAENVHDVIYRGGYATYTINVQDYAIDELLDHYSKDLIELTKKISENLTYQSRKEIKKYKSEIKGKIKWQKTIRLRFQKGLSHSTAHVCERRKRIYTTPTNLLLLKFHIELFTEGATMLARLQQREAEKMRWKQIYKQSSGGEYDKGTLDKLTRLRSTLRVHKFFLTQAKFREALPMLRVVSKDNPELIRRAEFESIRAKNRSYKPMIALYKDFIAQFEPMFMKMVPIDTQRTRDFYRVWAMCELADALDLKSIGHTMREFKNHYETIFMYFQNIESLRHPWSEISPDAALYMGDSGHRTDLSFIGPEIYMVYEGVDIFVDTIYGYFIGGLPRDKIYEVLGYMNDFGFNVGVVLYPGKRFHIKVDQRNPNDPKILIEAPFIPETSDSQDVVQKRKDYLKYLAWSAVTLYRAARKKDKMGRIVKSITRTVEVKYSMAS